jgi:hypothetical protein
LRGILHSLPNLLPTRRIRRTYIQNHLNVRANDQLNLYGFFGGEEVGGTVYVGAEGDAFGGDLAQGSETKNLVTAAIREDGFRPLHKAVKAARLPKDF